MPVVRHPKLSIMALISLASMTWPAVPSHANVISAGEQVTLHSEILGEENPTAAVAANLLTGSRRTAGAG